MIFGRKDKKKYIVVKHSGKMNAIFKVTNPKKIEFWKVIAEKVSPVGAYFVKTEIIKEGYLK